jgi:hypothetical protein
MTLSTNCGKTNKTYFGSGFAAVDYVISGIHFVLQIEFAANAFSVMHIALLENFFSVEKRQFSNSPTGETLS